MATIRPVDDFDRVDDTVERAKREIRKAVPGIIQSFDPETITCVVELGIYGGMNIAHSGNYTDRETEEAISYPLVIDAPVVFPRGGGATLTFPITAGDECLVIFSDRSIDFWWQSGGTQIAATKRMHSFSDAFVIPGPQSQAKKISGISIAATQLRSDDGEAFVEVNPSSHDISLATPGKLTATAGEIVVNGPTTFNGPVTFNGGITQIQGAGNASFGGSVNASGDIKAGNISLQGHIHNGVQTGGGNTGKPQ